MLKKITSFLLIIILLFSNFPKAFANEADKEKSPTSQELVLTSPSAVLIDALSGKVLFEKNAHEKLPPASITKIMTVLLLMESIEEGRSSLKDKVTISKYAADMGGSQLYMEVGETHTVEDLLYAIIVESANDACGAIAEYISGDISSFTKLMNKRAKELGMNDTNFMNSNGLPDDNHYTSAYDIALMSKELVKHKDIFKYTTTWMHDLTIGKNKDITRTLANTNKLLKMNPKVDGLKTGYTSDALYCMSATAKSGDMRLIAVVLKCDDSKVRFNEANHLLEYGFNKYEISYSVKADEKIGKVDVYKGKKEKTIALAKDSLYTLTKKGEESTLTKKIYYDKTIYSAPIKKGERLGEIICYENGKEIGRTLIVAQESLPKIGILSYLLTAYTIFFNF